MGCHANGKAGARRAAMRCAGIALIATLGLLLWARLKLVTETPRMVYADPPVGAPDAPDATGAGPDQGR